MAIQRAHHALQNAKAKSRSHFDAIKLAAKEFDVDIKYVDLVIKASVCFIESFWV
jgi:hypothetical protein